jgi:hypothetical protein
MMDSTEIAKHLKQRGWEVIDVVVNRAGRFVKLIEHTDGRTVAMFAPDTEDLARGRATVEEIIARNVGADLADPWPKREAAAGEWVGRLGLSPLVLFWAVSSLPSRS